MHIVSWDYAKNIKQYLSLFTCIGPGERMRILKNVKKRTSARRASEAEASL